MKESKKMTRTTATAETGASAPTEESFLRLLGRVRHDLRSPLGHIIGFGEILLEEAAASGADGLLEGLRSILQVANEALGRVNALLNAGPPEARAASAPWASERRSGRPDPGGGVGASPKT